LGHSEYMNVIDLANIVCNRLNLNEVEYKYSGGKRGWIGDTPFVHLDISKISSLGWKPQHPKNNSKNSFFIPAKNCIFAPLRGKI